MKWYALPFAQQRIRPPPTMPHVDMINYHNAHFIVAE